MQALQGQIHSYRSSHTAAERLCVGLFMSPSGTEDVGLLGARSGKRLSVTAPLDSFQPVH